MKAKQVVYMDIMEEIKFPSKDSEWIQKVLIGGVLIALLLALILGFLLPMALSLYVKESSIGAAFGIKEVLSRIKSVFGDYIIVYIVVIALAFILGVLSSIPVMGFLIMIFGGFYISAVAYDMFGKVCARSKV